MLTGTVLYLVLSRGQKGLPLRVCCVPSDLFYLGFGYLSADAQERIIWDELPIIGQVAITPCIMIPALIFHFVNLYTGRPIKWAIVLLWVLTALSFVPILLGTYYQIDGSYTYAWGNIFRVKPYRYGSNDIHLLVWDQPIGNLVAV